MIIVKRFIVEHIYKGVEHISYDIVIKRVSQTYLTFEASSKTKDIQEMEKARSEIKDFLEAVLIDYNNSVPKYDVFTKYGLDY